MLLLFTSKQTNALLIKPSITVVVTLAIVEVGVAGGEPVPVLPLPPPPHAVRTATAALMRVNEKGEKTDFMGSSFLGVIGEFRVVESGRDLRLIGAVGLTRNQLTVLLNQQVADHLAV